MANRSLTFSHGSLEVSLSVPTTLFFTTSQLKEQFERQLPEVTEGFAGDDEPASPTELLAKFLGYVSDLIDPSVSGPFDQVLPLVLHEFENSYLNGKDVHTLASTLIKSDQFPTTLPKVKLIIKNYFNAKIAAKQSFDKVETSLLKAVSSNEAKLVAIFGGQGNTDDYFEELRDIYNTYNGLISDVIESAAKKLNELVRSTNDTSRIYTQGFDLIQWLKDPESTPSNEYLLSIPVSCPLICVIQLAHYALTARILGLTPGELRSYLSGATGHSQGLTTALAIAESDSWDSFFESLNKSITFLFYIGVRCYQVYPNTALSPSILEDSSENGEGNPYPMLSVRDLSREQVQNFIDQTNSHLPKEKHIAISLVNGARNLVVSGPPQSLYGLNLTLRKNKAPAGLDQARIPFSERKLKFSNRFLPITSPFHSHLLEEASVLVKKDLLDAGLEFNQKDLKLPVYDTFDGKDLREFNGSIIERLNLLITRLPVNWETATQFSATHLLDFGPGGASGLGVLTHRNKDGTGVRIIIAGALDNSIDDEFGFKQEIFDINNNVKYAQNWLVQYQPKLVKTKNGKVFVDTKFSRLLGRAPILVPGMTPTTVHPDFVAATMNAGYHIEIAGGGYFDPKTFTKAMQRVVEQVPAGSGIGINLIYVNPRMLQWGIPLIKQLREQGFPIQSLTIGAGVPSLDVATEYIETLGLTHLGLKPGSVDSISQAISIAKAHPNFPIVLQWTGGRGGGHHSFEDFHQPILQMYSKIRRCSNISLIAGSGFGSAEDTYPYLTGEWSKEYNYPPMPFDGILTGSRVMVAKEAFTSPAAKQAIADAPGVPDEKWEQTYKKPTGGIITVRSEMGEPIHKLATRGVLLWHEMDNTIFNLPKNKLQEALDKKKDYIIGKLNADFQKPWFATIDGKACDLEDLTYEQIAKRAVELMYVRKSKRWIDVSLRNFVGSFLRRVEERFASSTTKSVLPNFQVLEEPEKGLELVFNAYPAARTQLINQQDIDFFLLLCQNPAQKPVPFVPVLDSRFEVFFKKDSLWQSEDLEAVIDEDVQRTCILHGPVAAQFTNKVDEPVKQILDSIHDGHISKLIKDVYSNDESKIPVVEYFGGSDPVSVQYQSNKRGNTTIYKVEDDDLSLSTWFNLLAGEKRSWRHAFISTERVIQGFNFVANPAKKVLSPVKGLVVEIENEDDPAKTVITAYDSIQGKVVPIVSIKAVDSTTIEMSLIEHRNVKGEAVSLPLLYKFNADDGFAPILEVTEDRNQRIKEFYWKLWFTEKFNLDIDVHAPLKGDEMTITGQQIAEFTHAIGNRGEDFVSRPGRKTLAPMDFAIVIGWKSIIKSIFPKTVDGDLLRLVHLSNGYKMLPGAKPLEKDDVVSSTAEIRSVVNQDSGKVVEVVGTIYREGKPVMEVNSQFLYRGDYNDFENTFSKNTEQPFQLHIKSAKDLAVLKSKEWFLLNDEETDLLNKTLTFEIETEVTYKNKTVFNSVKSSGKVLLELPTKEIIEVGEVEYEAGSSHGNPVIDYLTRNGSAIEQKVKFENRIPIASVETRAPGTNEPYAVVSGDYNPIHVSRVFANYANLPGTITHGMYSSASVRALVESWAADSVSSRVRAFNVSFVGMVLPNTRLTTTLEHVGMINGRKIIEIKTVNENDEPVLTGQAEVDQPVSTFVFTGQGSQEQGMGMDLYEKSDVAREVWDRADIHFLNTYGFSIIDIVKNNPEELTVHFGGEKGRSIKKNYTQMTFETIIDGKVVSEKIFKEIDDKTASFTFKNPGGLISATQFTQPALTLMEKASYEDLKSKGLIPADCIFAGHSLGEYASLASLAEVMSIESLVEIVFYRGMTMQVAVPRDELGRSNYGMVAANPSRVSATFSQDALQFVVDRIDKRTQWLCEIVNYNVENQQYVAAGDLRALDTLGNVLNVIKLQKIDIGKLQQQLSIEQVEEHLNEIIDEVSKKSSAKPQPIELERGFATIPLRGISVPFHSSYLRSGVKPFKAFLEKNILKENVKPHKLIGKYIPNLTAKPFEVTKEYFQDVYELTKSDKIKEVLDNWEKYQK